MSKSNHKEWYTRGYLPHYDHGKTCQMITYRLADSLLQEKIEQFEQEIQCKSSINKSDELRGKIETWLDNNHGSCILRKDEYAAIIVENWQKFHGISYDLISWVVMPNHVHLLIDVHEGFQLGKIVLSWKNYTAREINRRINSSGRLWQRGYWDRYARNEKHYLKILEYIRHNYECGGVRYGITKEKQ